MWHRRLIYYFNLFSFFFGAQGFAHIGHKEELSFLAVEESSQTLMSWLHFIGHNHFIFLHFPIALIMMTAVAELLNFWFNNPLFDHAARFMIIAAAIFALPTALLGLALGSSTHYEGAQLDLYQWHRAFGLSTAILAIITASLRESYTYRLIETLTPYYIALAFLFIFVNLAGTFGGKLTFGV